MQIEKQKLLGNSFVGVFSTTNDKKTFLPSATTDNFIKAIKGTLKTKSIKLNLCNSSLIGLFSASNENGIVIPEMAYESEITILEKHFDNVATISQYTAVGNLVTANQNGCIASPLLNKKSIKIIENTLGVKVKRMQLAGIDVVGSCVLATSKGFLANPNITDQEFEMLEELFGVEGNIGSINYGVPFIKGGLIANKNGAIVGSETTSYELGRIDEALFLGRENK
ncbi:translation initiation factor IF-6 [archaeon]|nr:translation initiation factor IF-6 [archaeon]